MGCVTDTYIDGKPESKLSSRVKYDNTTSKISEFLLWKDVYQADAVGQTFRDWGME